MHDANLLEVRSIYRMTNPILFYAMAYGLRIANRAIYMGESL